MIYLAQIPTLTLQELEQNQDKPSKILNIHLRPATVISRSTLPHMLYESREMFKPFLLIYFRKQSYCLSTADNNTLL